MTAEAIAGWIGSENQLLHALRTFGAEADEEGKILVRGTIVSFLGIGDEFVVHADAECRIDGRWCKIAPLLHQTSYGQKVAVI